MSAPESNTNKSYPVVWQAMTRLPYEGDLKRQAMRVRTYDSPSRASQDFVAFEESVPLIDTTYHRVGKDFELKSIRDVLLKGLPGLESYAGKQATQYSHYSSGLFHAVQALRREDADRYAETIKALPELEKAFAAADTAVAALRRAEQKDWVTTAKKLNAWIAEESDLWVRVDQFTTYNKDKRRNLTGCSLLRLTGLVVDDRILNETNQFNIPPSVRWQGTGLNGVTGTYPTSPNHVLYLLSGPKEELPVQFAYPRQEFL